MTGGQATTMTDPIPGPGPMVVWSFSPQCGGFEQSDRAAGDAIILAKPQLLQGWCYCELL
jgi:hypothetical protein